MKSPFRQSFHHGFTLLELMVSMAITTIIIGVLVGITSVATDAWNRSRSEIRAAQQGKALADAMSMDFQALVTRRSNNFEWLYADLTDADALPGDKTKSSNASNLIFFTAATDKYDDGANTGGGDQKGDVSCVSYQLAYQDPVSGNDTGKYNTFAVYRLLVNPDEAFKMLGQPDLKGALGGQNVLEKKNFVCENVYQFTVKFSVEVQPPAAGNGVLPPKILVPVTLSKGGSGGSSGSGTAITSAKSLRFLGNTMEIHSSSGGEMTVPGVTKDQLDAGRLVSVDISLTVLNDLAINQLRVRNFQSDQDKAEFIAKNSYQFSKTVDVTSL